MGVTADPLIRRHHHGAMAPGGRDKNLVGGIAVKGLRQLTALHEYRTRQLPEAQAP